MKRLVSLMLGLMLALPVVGADVDSRYREAGKAYADRNYEEAYRLYQEVDRALRAEGVRSFDVAFNLGCTAYRLGRMADARYWFETARRLKPGGKDVNRNLAVVTGQLVDNVKSPPVGYLEARYRDLVRALPYNAMAGLVLLALVLSAGFAALLIAGRMRRKPLWYGFSISLVVLLGAVMLLNSRAGEMTRPEAVILSEVVDVFSEPNTSSSLLFRLHAGTLVSVEDSEGGYLHIALPDGMNGWARAQDMRLIQ